MRETYYKIPMHIYSHPIELFGTIFYYIIKRMWKYELILFIMVIVFSFSHNIYNSVFCFILYSFIAFFMIAWHEFGHAIMYINENFGIVNLYLKFDKKGLFIYPSVTHYKNARDFSNSTKVILGGVVATLVFNSVINIVLFFILQKYLAAKLFIGFYLVIMIPLLILLEYFSSDESTDIYKLKKLYSLDNLSKKNILLARTPYTL